MTTVNFRLSRRASLITKTIKKLLFRISPKCQTTQMLRVPQKSISPWHHDAIALVHLYDYFLPGDRSFVVQIFWAGNTACVFHIYPSHHHPSIRGRADESSASAYGNAIFLSESGEGEIFDCAEPVSPEFSILSAGNSPLIFRASAKNAKKTFRLRAWKKTEKLSFLAQ